MKRLLLLRHAKSSWDDPEASDHSRPLNERGRRASVEVGRHMKEAGYVPDLILCSNARRTVETYERVVAVLGANVPVSFEGTLYLADWPVMLDVARRAPDSAKCVLVIGHNPGMEQLALALSDDEQASETAMSRHFGEKFPTAALAVLDFAVTRWRSLKPRKGKLTAFVRPKDL